MKQPDISNYYRMNCRMSRVSVAVFIAMTFILVQLQGQNNTLYLMHSIPQANQLNPAIRQKCKMYLALPLISSVRLNLRNTSFGFHDVIHTGTGPQSSTYYLDIDNLQRRLKKMNYTLLNSDIDLIGLGLSIKDWYFTFGISNHVSMQLSYPDDIVSLKDGNWDTGSGDPLEIKVNRIGANATVWNSIGISASRDLFEGLRAGARIRYINGMANLNTRRSKIEINTTSDPITLEALVNYRINSSIPVNLGYSANGLVSSLDFSPATNNLLGNYIFNGNRGLSLDGGIVYDYDEETQFTASFTDLGFILWRKNVHNFKGEGEFVFQGIDLDAYFDDPNQGDLIQALQDSVLNSFHASASSKGYITMLPLNFYGGITRELVPDLKAGAMTWIEVNGKHIRPSLTLSLNASPFKAFAASLSYTIMNYKLNQLGAGLAFGNRGAQFYILADNIPVRFTRDVSSGLIWPYNARMLSLRFGLNIFFGCREEERSSAKRKFRGSDNTDYCPAYW